MKKYSLNYYANIYSVLNNDYIVNNLYSLNELQDEFNKMSKNGIVAIFEHTENNINLIDPYTVGIFDSLSHSMYKLAYKTTDYITDNLKIISNKFYKAGANDLGDFIYLITNVGLNKNTKLSYDNALHKIKNKKVATLFKYIYKRAYNEAKLNLLDSPEKLALLQAIKSTGIDV